MNLTTLAAPLGSAHHLIRGYRLLLLPGVRTMMLLPVLGNTVLFVLALVLAWNGLDAAMVRWIPESLDWLRWLLFPLALLLLLVLAFFGFTLVGNLIFAPFHGLLAERVEFALTGRRPASSGRSLWRNIARSLREELGRLLYIAIRMLGVFALGFIPVIGLLALPLGVLLGAWLLALEFAANPLGNWDMDFAAQRALMRRHRLGFLGFGLGAMGLALVPVLNFALLPAAVAGMTAYCLQLRAQEAASALVTDTTA